MGESVCIQMFFFKCQQQCENNKQVLYNSQVTAVNKMGEKEFTTFGRVAALISVHLFLYIQRFDAFSR